MIANFPTFMNRVSLVIILAFGYPVFCVIVFILLACHGAAKEICGNFPSFHAYMIEAIKLGWKGK